MKRWVPTISLVAVLFAGVTVSSVWGDDDRSEEHTSELQSQSNLVCRLLLEKKNLRRKRSSPNVFEMAATATITSIILIKLLRVSLGTVRHPRRFKIVVIDIQITLKQMLRDFIGIRVNRAKKSGMVNITSSVNSRERSGINTILPFFFKLFATNEILSFFQSKPVSS